MRAFAAVPPLLFVVAQAAGQEPGRAKELLRSPHYTTTFGNPVAMPDRPELEVGEGSGHGFWARWLRFVPAGERVTVLSVEYRGSREQYVSKWPPDRATVTTAAAELPAAAYAALLAELRVVATAKLKPVPALESITSTSRFWVHARVAAGDREVFVLDHAGYPETLFESKYARPKAAVALAEEAVKGLKFLERPPTAAERAWVSAKFARDWAAYRKSQSHWFVRERHIEMVGRVGDAAALLTLRTILEAGLTKDKAENRPVYLAVNAVTRLTGRDVRDQPVEEMDREANRRRVLDLLREAK